MHLGTETEHIKIQSQGLWSMASSQVKEVKPCSSKDQQEGSTTEPPVLSHNVPVPHNLDKSKLDWLLQINEQFFEAELRNMVSSFNLLLSLCHN